MRAESAAAPTTEAPPPSTTGASPRTVAVWLGCLSSRRAGLVRRLVREVGSVAEVLERPSEEIAAALADRPSRRRGAHDDTMDDRRFAELLAAGPEACLRAMEARPSRDRVVAWCDQDYPAGLRQLADPPFCLFVRAGCRPAQADLRLRALATEPVVAVVGTRAPSVYGEEMARLLGRDLGRAGLVVVSGLALGIDAVAHRGALEGRRDGGLPTVAVLGCGADVVYPRTNTRLYAEIAASGLLVSEFAWGVPARPWRFPARNRIMAALSRAVVLVEGTQRSGARITAGFALELGREILCVPGESGRRLSEAPLQLLREGAKLCESAADVLKAMRVEPLGLPVAGEPGSAAHVDAGEILDFGAGTVRAVLAALGDGPATIDDLSGRCRLGAAIVAAAVGELEIEGLVRRVDGGLYRLRRT